MIGANCPLFIIGRIKKNIELEKESEYGTLEMQSRWVAWQELVIAMDLSWNKMFKFGDALIGFALSVVYGTVITPSVKSKWDENEGGNCKLCVNNRGTIQHISCQVALSHCNKEGTHGDIILIKCSSRFMIKSIVMYHVENMVNNPRQSTKNEGKIKNIEFVHHWPCETCCKCSQEEKRLWWHGYHDSCKGLDGSSRS